MKTGREKRRRDMGKRERGETVTQRKKWRMETIQCPWKPIRLIWIWDWGLLLSSFASYDLLLALLLRSPISLISPCSSLPDALSRSLSLLSLPSVVHYRSLLPKQISFHDGWALWTLVQKLCQIFCSCSKSWEAGGSVRDMCGSTGQGLSESREGFGSGCLASFWHLCQRLDLVVVGEAATMLALGKLLHAR